jgi:hypothetical protein
MKKTFILAFIAVTVLSLVAVPVAIANGVKEGVKKEEIPKTLTKKYSCHQCFVCQVRPGRLTPKPVASTCSPALKHV